MPRILKYLIYWFKIFNLIEFPLKQPCFQKSKKVSSFNFFLIYLMKWNFFCLLASCRRYRGCDLNIGLSFIMSHFIFQLFFPIIDSKSKLGINFYNHVSAVLWWMRIIDMLWDLGFQCYDISILCYSVFWKGYTGKCLIFLNWLTLFFVANVFKVIRYYMYEITWI